MEYHGIFGTPSFETTYMNLQEDYSVIYKQHSTRLNVIELFAMWTTG